MCHIQKYHLLDFATRIKNFNAVKDLKNTKIKLCKILQKVKQKHH